MKKILLVEDDTEISQLLTTVLSNDYHVTPAYSGTEGLLQFAHQEFDLVLLDIMLSGKTGEEVLLEIREKSGVPIVMLTALSDKKLISDFLLKGADDYLTKPFDIEELQARIAVQIRRTGHQQVVEEKVTRYKNIQLAEDMFQLIRDDQSVQLAKKEFLIFQLLVSHPNKIYTKEDLYEKVWGEPYFGDENTVNVHISNLRKKLQKLDAETPYIETVWSLGIKLAK